MLKRGFVHFLSRVGARPVRKIGMAVLLAGLVGVVQAGDGIGLKRDAGQAPQQSASEDAVSHVTVPASWPWESVDATAEVRRLGLSATLVAEKAVAEPRWTPPVKTEGEDLQLGDVAIGDRVTVTTSNGLSQVYTVTGRELSNTNEPQPDACLPLDSAVAGSLRLIIEAIHGGRNTPAPSAEQRL